MNPLAEELNKTISNFPVIWEHLSPLGKRVFYPTKGIVAQSAEAKSQADPIYNATVGIATDRNGPLSFKSIEKFFNTDELTPSQIFDYSGSYGQPKLRSLWKERMVEINPGLQGKEFSLPIVTGGLTNSLSITADLFFQEGDTLILPDQIWGNYRLMFNTIRGAEITSFSFFQDGHFNQEDFERVIKEEATKKNKVSLLLNFPNNPTGYSPTKKEASNIIAYLNEVAKNGTKVLVILDEAYHGLFFDDDLIQESLFSQLANLHENILTVNVCGATKEFYVWGFRIGFLSFGTKAGTAELYQALEQKSGGLLRGNVSNESTSAQNIMIKVLDDKSYLSDMTRNYNILKNRANKVKKVLDEHIEYQDFFTAYPFNSGYFMLLKLNGLDSDTVRRKLLEEKVGTITTAKYDLRVAFSCVEEENIEHVFAKIYQVCKELAK